MVVYVHPFCSGYLFGERVVEAGVVACVDPLVVLVEDVVEEGKVLVGDVDCCPRVLLELGFDLAGDHAHVEVSDVSIF